MSCFKFDPKPDNNVKHNKNIGIRSQWVREFFAEMFGTFFIVAIGDGAIANYLLNKDNKLGVDHFAVCFAFGIGVLIGVTIAAPISGAHLNPAVTIALTSLRKFPVRKIGHYLLGQYTGSLLGALAVFVTYYEAINAYDGGSRAAYYDDWHINNTSKSRLTGSIFSTYPAPHVTIAGSLVDQIVATFLMMFAVCAVTNQKGIKNPKHFEPLILAFVITAICVAFGLNCGAVLNPARDLAPRMFTSFAGYGIQPFRPLNSLYWLTAGLIGPHLGAIAGAWVHQLTIFDDTVENTHDLGLNDIKATETNHARMAYNHTTSPFENSDQLFPFIDGKDSNTFNDIQQSESEFITEAVVT